ncbi:MAG: hypothetical protein LBP56_01215 [Odoribacteraceae bacterium]|jgi:hypothetical protein|nr:hypothetical protein [Odoribacteraceae bacterium]
MKKIIVTCTLGILLAFVSHAQEIKPSEQAQGMAQVQNAVVDHSTGIFNYKVPLFELASGDYKLPVTLSYTASGVKVDDTPGTCGYGWHLMAGGVVTRTMRGGLPDEKYHTGYSFKPVTAIDDQVRKDVSKHYRDGESDIFTAAFNGRTVHFIIAPTDIPSKFRVAPLEKTGVKIEHEMEMYTDAIKSWKITDENGIVYIFDEIEQFHNLEIGSEVARNGVSGLQYNSSWYLSEIILPTSKNIKFRYTDQIRNLLHDPYDTDFIYYSYFTTTAYQYGSPIQEYRFDLTPHQESIKNLINSIKWNLSYYHLNLQLEYMNQRMDALQRNGSFSLLNMLTTSFLNAMRAYDHCLGIIGNLSPYLVSTQQIFSDLNAIENSIQGSSIAVQMIKSEINALRQIYVRAFSTPTLRKYSSSSSGRTYKSTYKYLSGITCEDQEVVLEYEDRGSRKALRKIHLLSYLRDTINRVELTNITNGLLKEITIKSPSSSEQSCQKFSYYKENEISYGSDIWGFYNGDTSSDILKTITGPHTYIHVPSFSYSEMKKEYERLGMYLNLGNGDPHADWIKRFSMKSIATFTGGQINIDYERNRLFNEIYGGIRTKNIVIMDGHGGRDSIHYHYNINTSSSAVLVINNLSLGEHINYMASDDIMFNRIQHDEIGILNTGNNGIIYTYVRAERVGNGSTAYYFCAPRFFFYTLHNIPFQYPYWLVGLPIGKVEYDKEGRKIMMSKNIYHATIPPGTDLGNAIDFVIDYQVPFPFSEKELQLKPSAYYMDGQSMANDYKNRPNIPICYYQNTFTYIHPYSNIYLPNLSLRVDYLGPIKKYDLYHGGRVTLKEQTEYIFDLDNDVPSQTHQGLYELFNKLPETGYVANNTSYRYGAYHCDPVQTTQVASNGDKIDVFIRKVADVSPENDMYMFIDSMKTDNVLAPVILQQKYITRNNKSFLVEENVTLYSMDTLKGKRTYFPVTNHLLKTDGLEAVSLPSLTQVSNLFSKDSSIYSLTRFSYAKNGEFHRMTGVSRSNESVSRIYDTGNGKLILEAKHSIPSRMDAIDFYRKLKMDYNKHSLIMEGIDLAYMPQYEKFYESMQEFNTFHQKYPILAAFEKEKVQVAIKYFISTLLDPFPSIDSLPYREIIREEYKNIKDLYTRSAENAHMNNNDKVLYLFVVNLIARFATYLDEDKFNAFKFTVDPNVAGLNLKKTLNAIVEDNYNYRLILFQNKPFAQTNSFNCKATYKDGTFTTFTKSISSEKGWSYKEVNIDLNGINNKENIQTIEINISNGIYATIYGIALAILVPVGTEFEAVSRDPFGRVFCKLNHLQQLERYEYDGLGRVIKVFNTRGDIIQEFEYNEVTITN